MTADTPPADPAGTWPDAATRGKAIIALNNARYTRVGSDPLPMDRSDQEYATYLTDAVIAALTPATLPDAEVRERVAREYSADEIDVVARGISKASAGPGDGSLAHWNALSDWQREYSRRRARGAIEALDALATLPAARPDVDREAIRREAFVAGVHAVAESLEIVAHSEAAPIADVMIRLASALRNTAQDTEGVDEALARARAPARTTGEDSDDGR